MSNDFTFNEFFLQNTPTVVIVLLLYIVMVLLINSVALSIIHSEYQKEKNTRAKKQNISRKDQIKDLYLLLQLH